MRLCIILIFSCLGLTGGYAQQASVDSLLNRIPSTDSLREFLPKDTLLQKSHHKVDSIQASFYHGADSLKGIYQRPISKLDSVQNKLQHRLDSLTTLNLPTGKVTHALDSVNQLREKTVASFNEKLNTLKGKTTGKLEQLELPPQLKDKVSSVTGKVDGFQIPGSELGLPSVGGASLGKIDGINGIGSMDGLNKINGVDLPQTGGLGGITDAAKVGELQNVTSQMGEVSKVTGQAGEYATQLKEVKAVAGGDLSNTAELSKTAETKAAELSGIKDLEGQTKVLDQYKDMAGKAADPEAMKEEAATKVKQMAVNHFAGKEKQLQEAMDMVSKYKQKYGSLNSLSDIPKKRPNEMHGKPWYERVLPGIAMQMQKKGEDLMVDFNPYAGYRFTGRITAGAGWNQRVAYNTKRNYFDHAARVYGPRVYGEFKLWKGFSPRLEVETMNTFVPPLTRVAIPDAGSREWVWGVFTGMKKEYRFIKNVKGTALIMVRLFDPHHKSPYADVLNVRFGFEFPIKKKPKTAKDTKNSKP
ncbi:hypothetical protein SAMN04488109_2929 [Chryseolinea serpens]|uniref:Uncharacterized protein n=1 Tax=Chryseolinea serpens TaxID=947013 RepID=A0A1M5QPI6_9BACT|nr:hypothetical protein [Chryseolinea serpens]SHH15791.1 hypothetical protein SAMN04488109_2929 [Chryseolinea serpens]